MAMLRKKKKKVRPASGPSFLGLPSCTTPVASEAKTSGMTTKNSSRRNTRPKGSSSTVETPRISSSTVPEDLMPTCVSQPWRNSGIGTCGPAARVATPRMMPMTSPRRMRLANLSEVVPAIGEWRGA